MEIITIASAKGGVSKTLLAVNLYDYLKSIEGKKVLLIDTDIQESAFDFLNELEEEDITTATTIENFNKVLQLAATEKYDYVVVDTSPTITAFHKEIISKSSKVLLPVKPARFDIKSIYNTIDLIKNTKVKSCVLFTQTINTSTNTKSNIQELKDIFNKENVEVLPCVLSNSVAYVNSINELKTIFRTKYTKQKLELTKIFTLLLNC